MPASSPVCARSTMTPTEVASMLGELSRACQQHMSTEGVFKRDVESLLSRLQEYGLIVRVKVDVLRGAGDVETIAQYGGPNRDAADSLGSDSREKGSYRFTIDGWCHREAAK